MINKKLAPSFGISIDPSAANPQEPFDRARIADENGIDLITIMDHPYNVRLFDTWTLLTAIGMATKNVHLAPNVSSLPLRPPAMLAKQAASLDILTNGRVEMGLGAGAFWDGIAAFGGPRRKPGEAYQAFKDALHIMRGMWDNAGKTFTYEGDIYQVNGVRPGPVPAHRIPIWVGAGGPRMLRLLGRMADGLFISYNYDTPENLTEFNRRIDVGVEEAGRQPTDIRRGYNLMGTITLGKGDSPSPAKGDSLHGDTDYWVDRIQEWYNDYGQDTFIFWPTGDNTLEQVETYAKTIVPAVKEALA